MNGEENPKMCRIMYPLLFAYLPPAVSFKVARFIWLPQSGFCNIAVTFAITQQYNLHIKITQKSVVENFGW